METILNGDGQVSPSAAGKKLKQSRLPFQILSGSPVTSPATKATPNRKRKPSIEADSHRATKIGRTSEAKENVKDAGPVVVIDIDSTEATDSLVGLNEDESQTEEDGGVSGGESTSNDKNDRIKIKFPIGKKKNKKNSFGDEGSAKKISKEKKKHKKEGKRSEIKLADETIVLEDSELSDTEKVKNNDNVATTESSSVEKNEDEKVTEIDEVQNVENSRKDEEVSSEVVSNLSEEAIDSKDGKNVDSVDEETNQAKKKVEDDAVTPRRTRLPRAVASQKTTESGTKNETPKSDRSAKKSLNAKKSDASSPKSIKKPQSESATAGNKDSSGPKPKSIDGALDKLFAKIKTESKAKDSDEKEGTLQKTPEKKPPKANETSPESMEVDHQGEVNVSAISVAISLDSTDEDNGADDEENAYMLCTPNSKERSLLADNKQEKKLTPKQIARRKEAELKLAAKQKEIEEKKRKKEEERVAKLREKEEQERLKKKEREEKEEQKRKEREEKEEQKRKEREEKEEQKRKEREEKERKRLAELEAKNEEKRKKDEQKEEERKKKEEEKEAEEKRKQKTAHAFQSFFVKKPTAKEPKQSDDENSMDRQSVGEGDVAPRLAFMPFCVKGDMRLAPVCRVLLESDRKKRLDEALARKDDAPVGTDGMHSDRAGLYLQQLKNKDYVVGRGERTWTAQDDEADEDDVMVIDENVCRQIEVDPSAEPSRRYRAKFFLFEENRRPPFRGTWRKRSSQIKPRRPFVQDTKFFDYEVDSDDEWEEEEPGESLNGSEDEKDVDPEDDYDVDNDFVVPHGHLSDEEMQAEDDVMDDNSPETQKAKLKIMQQEFAAEMKKKTEKIKPRLIGCLWENGPGEGPECSAVIWEILKARAMLFDPEEPISFTTAQKNEPESNNTSPLKEKEVVERKPKQVKLTDEGVKELITLIHGSALNRKFLVKEFLAYWGKRRDDGEFNVPQFAPDSVRTKILEVASWRPCPDEGPMQNKMCWYVNKEALVKYELMDLKIPTGWEFILKPITKGKKEKKLKKDEETNGAENGDKKADLKQKESPKEKEKNERLQSTPNSVTKSKSAETAAASRITKFTKKLSEDDKRKQFSKEKKANPASPAASPRISNKNRSSKATVSGSAASASSSTVDVKPVEAKKKRVQLLMSVPRGQNINQATKSNLLSQFLAKTNGSTGRSKPEAMEVDPPSGDADVIALDD